MKLYESKETTPLKFYKFFMYVWAPLGVLGCIYSAAFTLTFYKNLNLYYEVAVANCILAVILYALMFWGLLKWKKFTFDLFIIMFASVLASNAFNIIYFFTGGSVPFSSYQLPNYHMSASMTEYMTTLMQSVMKTTAVISAVFP